MITEIAHAKSNDGMERKERCLQSKVSKEIYNCKITVFISKKMRSLKIMDKVLSNPE